MYKPWPVMATKPFNRKFVSLILEDLFELLKFAVKEEVPLSYTLAPERSARE
jgi:hypothetical protein